MAKYCSHCGKELKANQKCDCQKKTEKMEEKGGEEVKVINSSAVESIFKEYVDVAKGIFKTPIDTLKSHTKEENITIGFIMILCNALITGLFAFLFIKEAMSSITDLLGSSLGYTYGLGSASMLTDKIPFSVVFVIFFYMVAGFFSTAGMIYFFQHVIFKTNTSFKKIVSLIGNCSVLTTVTMIVAIVFTYISLPLTILFIILAGILYLTHLYHGMIETMEWNPNRIGYVFVSSIAVASFVVLYLLPKIFS